MPMLPAAAAKPIHLQARASSRSPTEMVCTALGLALIFLAWRITSVWW